MPSLAGETFAFLVFVIDSPLSSFELSWYICTTIHVKLAQDRSPSPDRLHFFGILRDIDSTSGHKHQEDARMALQMEGLWRASPLDGFDLALLIGGLAIVIIAYLSLKEWLERQAETK